MTKIRWALDPATTALAVVDMQNDFLLPESPLAARGGLALLPRINRLIAAARGSGALVLFTATTNRPGQDRGRMADLFPAGPHGPLLADGTPGWQLHPDVDRRPEEPLIPKPRYSAFWGTGLDDLLRARSIDALILAGVWTNCCVEATARDAFFRDYRVVCVADGTATGDLADLGHGAHAAEDVQRLTLADLAAHVGEVATTADLVHRLTSR
jgi:ureidoacrylate peracid hydrolase